MHFSLVAVCVVVGTAHVLAGCAEDHSHEPALNKEIRELKDVEWIGKDLKFKLDHGIDEKELLEKRWEADYHAGLDKSQPLDGGKAEFSLKDLHAMLGGDFEKDLSDHDLKVLMTFLEHLSSKGKLFPKKEPAGKDSFVKEDGMHYLTTSSDEHGRIKKSAVYSTEDSDDAKSYLAESLLHMAMNQDAEKYHHDTEVLHKKLDESKAVHSGESAPYFLMHDDAKASYKGLSQSERMVNPDDHEKVPDGEDMKKILKIIFDGDYNEKGSLLLKEITEHPLEEKNIKEILKKLSEKLHSEKGFDIDEEHFLKALMEHGGVHALDKDRVYDEILKKEDHSLDEIHDDEKLYENQEDLKTLKVDEHLKVSSAFEIGAEKDSKALNTGAVSKSITARAAEKGKKVEEGMKSAKDLDIDELLKEDGYYMTGGTHAYETARDQAHIDAKTPSLLDEASKGIYNHKVLSEEGKKTAFHSTDEDHILGESMYGKDKSAHDSKFAYGEETLKAFKGQGIGTEFAEEKKIVHNGRAHDESWKGKEAYGVGLSDDHLFKTDESHLMHDKDLAPDHHVKHIDESIAKEKPHQETHSLKNTFVSFLKRVLRMRKCHLVTMRPAELLNIVDCISRSKDPSLCEKFAMCEKKKPLQIILALEKCQKEIIPKEVKRCTTYEPLYPSREIPMKIFQCIAKNTRELMPDEKKQMIDFEECARMVKVEGCGRIPWG